MSQDPIRGRSIRFTFEDGPMAGKTMQHDFAEDGSLSFFMAGSDDKPTRVAKYEVASHGDDVHAISYLGSSGYTLTVVLSFETGRLVGFASNEKSLTMQQGTFEYAAAQGSKAGSRSHART